MENKYFEWNGESYTKEENDKLNLQEKLKRLVDPDEILTPKQKVIRKILDDVRERQNRKRNIINNF